MTPAAAAADGPAGGDAAAADPVVHRYRRCFARRDWTCVPERAARRPWPGSPPHPPPKAADVKALLVKLGQGKRCVMEVRTFLVEHPRLVRELGFRPVREAPPPHGVDGERTVPGDRWRRHQPQTRDPAILTALLAGTVWAVPAALPGLGPTVAGAGKHSDAWVRETHPKERIAHRHDPARQPRGDPAGRLGAKCRPHQAGRQAKADRWGDGTGLVCPTDPVPGDVVLADLTQPVTCQDVTDVAPVHRQAVAALGGHPTNRAAAAAVDAWHVDHGDALRDGVAAIPRNDRGTAPPRDGGGHPIGARGPSLVPTAQCDHADGFQAPHDRCPVRRSRSPGAPCDHPPVAPGGGTKATTSEAGGRRRSGSTARPRRWASSARWFAALHRAYARRAAAAHPP